MEKQKVVDDWMKDLNEEKIRKSAEFEIYPKLVIPNIPPNEEKGKAVKVEFLEQVPKMIDIPEPKFAKVGFVVSVLGLEDNIKYSLWLPYSLRFKLAVLIKQCDGILKGLKVNIWKEKADLKDFQNATVYNVQLID